MFFGAILPPPTSLSACACVFFALCIVYTHSKVTELSKLEPYIFHAPIRRLNIEKADTVTASNRVCKTGFQPVWP
jgi:hypothetical protein